MKLIRKKQKKLDEEEMIEGLRKGDERITRIFYNQHKKNFFKYVAKYYSTLEQEKVIDVYHQSIIRVVEITRDGRTLKFSLKTYLFNSGRFIIMKDYRKKTKSIPEIVSISKEHEDYCIIAPEEKEINEQDAMYSEILDKALLQLNYFENIVMRDYLFNRLNVHEIVEKYEFKDVNHFIKQRYRYNKKIEELTLKIYHKEYGQSRKN